MKKKIILKLIKSFRREKFSFWIVFKNIDSYKIMEISQTSDIISQHWTSFSNKQKNKSFWKINWQTFNLSHKSE